MPATPNQIWWSAAELADAKLPDLPGTKRKVQDRANREGWINTPGKARKRRGQGGGVEYHWTVLPLRARMALLNARAAPEPVVPREEAWANYDGLKAGQKAKADARLQVIYAVDEITAAGFTRSRAVQMVAVDKGVSDKSIWNWLGLVEGIPQADWLAYLAPKSTARKSSGDSAVDPDFFALVKSDYLRPEQPSMTACYDRAVKIAEADGLRVSPLYQVRRLFKATVSKPTVIYCRKGAEARRRFYPHQTRSKSALRVMQAVQGDFHKFDLFINWPGEADPVRVQAVFFSDIYSGMLLSWRLSLTANSHTVQLAIGDMVERYGIPEQALLDNGREFAAKVITGGAPTRFRFKVMEDDIPGLLPMLGVQVHWATPYSGQSKPIERAFRDLCDRVSKHPAFAGAYTGNKPDAKPENYRSRAVDLDVFRTVLAEEIKAHNERPNRRSEVAYGRSFKDVFDEGYKTAPIKKATAEQRRLWLMGAQGVRAKDGNGELSLLGSRYWSEWMYRIAGQKIVARFDPDNLHAGLHVYDLDGQYLGAAACVKKGDFFGVSDAREVARKRGQYLRTAKAEAKAQRELSAAEIAAKLRAAGEEVEADDLPEADVIQLTTAHRKAPKPTERPVAARPVEAAPVARLDDRRAPVSNESAEDRFNRAVELEEILSDGHSLTAEQENWLREFQKSAEYKTQKDLRDAFGGR
jgi:hypothetical protein